jgi:hypothetical protein
MVYACTVCQTEQVDDGEMRIVRKTPDWHDGPRAAQVLLTAMLRSGVGQRADDGSRRSLQGAVSLSGQEVRGLRSRERSAASAPQRPRPAQLEGNQHRDFVPEVPHSQTQQASTKIEMCGLPHPFRGVVSQGQSEDLFCPVCESVGPHMCSQEMGPARVGRLKAYGNAIVAPLAATFIRAAMSAMIESAPARRATPEENERGVVVWKSRSAP